MKRVLILGTVSVLCGTVAVREAGGQQSASPAASERALVNQYCVTCHSDKLKTGDLSLEKLNLEQVGPDAATWEKVIRKVRSGMMPPAGARRPDRATLDSFASVLETSLDRAAAAKPNPGVTALHRM